MKVLETMREQAIADCKYGYELGDVGDGKFTALWFHINLWTHSDSEFDTEDDIEYRATIAEIKSKLFTEECLLK